MNIDYPIPVTANTETQALQLPSNTFTYWRILKAAGEVTLIFNNENPRLRKAGQWGVRKDRDFINFFSIKSTVTEIVTITFSDEMESDMPGTPGNGGNVSVSVAAPLASDGSSMAVADKVIKGTNQPLTGNLTIQVQGFKFLKLQLGNNNSAVSTISGKISTGPQTAALHAFERNNQLLGPVTGNQTLLPTYFGVNQSWEIDVSGYDSVTLGNGNSGSLLVDWELTNKIQDGTTKYVITESRKFTYSYVSPFAGPNPIANMTDFLAIENPVGSGKVVKLTKLLFQMIVVAGRLQQLRIMKRTALDTGSTPIAVTAGKSHTADPTASGLVRYFSVANPTINDAGVPLTMEISSLGVNFQNGQGRYEYSFGTHDKQFTLNEGEGLYINFQGTNTVATDNIWFYLRTTEE